MRMTSAIRVSLVLLTAGGCSAAIPTISNVEYMDHWVVDSTYVLVDVRTEDEWNDSTGHLAGAILLPIQELEAEPHKADQFSGHKVVVYCRSGGRGSRATRLLRERGIDAYNLSGGIRDWGERGLPVLVEPPRDTTSGRQ